MAEQHNAELHMTLDKVEDENYDLAIVVNYRSLDHFQVGQLEALYFSFFASLPEAMDGPAE